MKVIDFISVFDECKNLIVKNTDDEIISVYDGKNAIDEIYNNCNIIEITLENGTITIYVK